MITAAYPAGEGPRRGAGGRRVYAESQRETALSKTPVNQITSFVVPAGSFIAVTFGMPFSTH